MVTKALPNGVNSTAVVDLAQQLQVGAPPEGTPFRLGSCLAIGYTAGAVARGITIDDLRIELVGNIDLPVFFGLAAGHAGYERIDARVYLKSEASRESIEALHADVVRTPPVGNTLERPAALHIQIATDPSSAKPA